jgi:hypothetical protein
MVVLTKNSVFSSSSAWATWAFPLLGLDQQSLPRWPFMTQFVHRVGLPSGSSFGGLFNFFAPSSFPELPEPLPSPMLLWLNMHTHRSSSVRGSLPCQSETAVFLHCSMLRRCPVTSSTMSLSRSCSISLEIATCSSGLGAMCNIFLIILPSMIVPPRTVILFASLVRRIEKSSTDFPSLNWIHVHLPHALDSDPQQLYHLPGRLSRALGGEMWQNLWRHCP